MAATANLDPIVELVAFAQLEFNHAIDYVWKAPALIETLAKEEEDKLKGKANRSRARVLRLWEQVKLKQIFPEFVAQGGLFLVCSLFEARVLQLAVEMRRTLGLTERRPGKGVTSWLNYLHDHVGVDKSSIPPWSQVDAAFKIRNCLMHAQGAIQLSRDATEIRRIVASGTFLVDGHKKRLSANPVAEVEIKETVLGERLVISNGYSWLVGSYLRDYFSNLCQATELCAKTRHRQT